LTIITDKLSIEVTESQEGLDCLYYIGGFLIIDYLDLLWIDSDTIYTNNKTKVLSLDNPELILLEVSLEACIL
jgi:hypothetical protein